MSVLKAAFGIKEIKEGEAFDRELQEQKKQQRIAERLKAEKEKEKQKKACSAGAAVSPRTVVTAAETSPYETAACFAVSCAALFHFKKIQHTQRKATGGPQSVELSPPPRCRNRSSATISHSPAALPSLRAQREEKEKKREAKRAKKEAKAKKKQEKRDKKYPEEAKARAEAEQRKKARAVVGSRRQEGACQQEPNFAQNSSLCLSAVFRLRALVSPAVLALTHIATLPTIRRRRRRRSRGRRLSVALSSSSRGGGRHREPCRTLSLPPGAHPAA